MKSIISLFAGLLFGFGLLLTGMYNPDVILSGLKIGASTFSWTLYLTFAIAFCVTFAVYQLRRIIVKPLTCDSYQLPLKNEITWQLIVGASLFGIGWGVCGICPGPNIVGLGMLHPPFYWVNFVGIILGFLAMKWLVLGNVRKF